MNTQLQTIKEYGFVKYLLDNGAEISPLEINYDENEILASMNPSIWIKDGIGYINIRAVNYNLFTSQYREYTQDDQPTAYVCKQETHLKTENFFGTINLETLEIQEISKVKMLKLHEPNWIFVGLEDARIIMWDENIYLCGVRRDIKDNGEGRMELSKIIKNENNEWEEIERIRIPAAGDDTAYLEKNWMPIIDKPFTWLKWSLPLEYCTYDIKENKLDNWFVGTLDLPYRGDSHLIHIDNYYYCFAHNVLCHQLREETNARIAYYCHYILRFNEDLSSAGVFGSFTYDTRFSVEFGCGLAYDGENCYLTYAENDAAAFIVKFNKELLINLPYNS